MRVRACAGREVIPVAAVVYSVLESFSCKLFHRRPRDSALAATQSDRSGPARRVTFADCAIYTISGYLIYRDIISYTRVPATTRRILQGSRVPSETLSPPLIIQPHAAKPKGHDVRHARSSRPRLLNLISAHAVTARQDLARFSGHGSRRADERRPPRARLFPHDFRLKFSARSMHSTPYSTSDANGCIAQLRRPL